jgi:hypothetical protein
MERHLDSASGITIAATLVLFGVALFTKGLSHDLLLEAGVFLVSAKLVLAGYKNQQTAGALQSRLVRIEDALARVERALTNPEAPPAA